MNFTSFFQDGGGSRKVTRYLAPIAISMKSI